MSGHIPVMARQAADILAANPSGTYLDCTAGLGGHMRHLLENRLSPQGRAVGIEWDPQAAARARENLAAFGQRALVLEGSYTDAAALLAREGIKSVDGAFFDFGVSSLQLDTPGRGFSFMADGPLDMRFSPLTKLTAAAIVNTWPVEQLSDILRRYGEEAAAGRIARAIAAARERAPLSRTLELAAVVEGASPRRGRTHPATRTFQALRIAVNGELDNVSRGLEAVSALVKPGGVLAALSFHSLEDRIIKRAFAALVERGGWRKILKKAAEPDEQETAENPRARSAKLRAIGRE
ncbi:MAG: 16S rRNA (cytosine(1402)-N(4))-methyltransferase RsmH [Elusimicrobia bacterium]|nr:16S rRNA (cytosine(1402)-N(4))-methyltransferase RsmH [Elusimicrobiota bacterium]